MVSVSWHEGTERIDGESLRRATERVVACAGPDPSAEQIVRECLRALDIDASAAWAWSLFELHAQAGQEAWEMDDAAMWNVAHVVMLALLTGIEAGRERGDR